LTVDRRVAPLFLLLAAACGVTPLTNKIDVGSEAFVVGIGEAPDGMTDLYAAPASGGTVFRVTFNRLQEQKPRLSASGALLVYLRSSPVETAEPEPEIVMLNLLTMAERGVRLPADAGRPTAVAWLPGDSAVAVRAGGPIWTFAAPPEPPRFTRVSSADSSRADSALAVLLGEPPFARIETCGTGAAGVCIRTASGETSAIDSTGQGGLRWGTDSLGFFSGGTFTVRPLGAGRARYPAWRSAPAGFRELTYHPGRPGAAAVSPPGRR